MARLHYEKPVQVVEGIEVGSRENAVLIALRAVTAQYDRVTSNVIAAWLSGDAASHISTILLSLHKKGFVVRTEYKGAFEYALTPEGAALVNPKGGQLSRRSIAALSSLC